MNKTVFTVAFSVLLAACGHVELQQELDGVTEKSRDEVSAKAADVVVAVKPPLVVRKTGAWLSPKTIALMPDADLPPAFNTRVTMIFPGRVSLSAVAEQVTKLTALPVRVKPDVFLPASALQPKNATTTSNQQVNNQATASGAGGLPNLPGVGVMGSAAALGAVHDFAAEMEINHVGSLASFLDMVSAKFGINWEYRDGAIHFYRLVTKTLTLKENPGSRSFNTDIGKTGGASTGASGAAQTASSGSNGSFNAAMAVQTKAGFSAWTDIKAAIDTMLTQVGQVSVSESTGTIVVTDTKEVVDRVVKLVEHENAVFTKQVAIRVDVIRVRLGEGDEFGMNWDLVYSKLTNLAPDWTIKTAGPSSLVGAAAASMGLSIVAPVKSDGSMTSRLSGSEALFRAIWSVNRNSQRISNSVVAKNRQPVPLAITEQVTYLAQTTPGVSTSNSTGGMSAVPGLLPGVVTTGYLLNLLPTVMDSDSVMLQFSLDLTQLNRIGKESTGQGETLQSINTPEVSGTQSMQHIGLRAGETLVISSYESDAGNYDKKTLDKNAPIGLGGSFTGKKNREAVVIMLTPEIRQGV